MNQVLIFLLETFLGLFALALLLRFHLQAVRAPARNPLSHFLSALTDFIVRPVRRVVPGLWGYDLSTLLLAWVTELVLVALVLALRGWQLGPNVGTAVVGVGLLAALNLLKLFLYVLIVAVIVQAVLSLVGRYSPATPILNAMTRPFLQIFQRRIPPVGNVDLSPLFVLVVCQILLMWPLEVLKNVLGRMLGLVSL
jgi:YggT family protein